MEKTCVQVSCVRDLDTESRWNGGYHSDVYNLN